MHIRNLLTGLALGLPLIAAGGGAVAQSSSDADYMKKVATAAPAQIVRDAAVVRMENGKMRTLKEGTNGFTCMLLSGAIPMCADAAAMEWGHALQTHTPQPDKIGFIYMLAGDNGTSNTNPYATAPQPGNHWVKTGPHVMLVGGGVKQMTGYPNSADPNVKEPYVMWPGTPYAHLMLPVE